MAKAFGFVESFSWSLTILQLLKAFFIETILFLARFQYPICLIHYTSRC